MQLSARRRQTRPGELLLSMRRQHARIGKNATALTVGTANVGRSLSYVCGMGALKAPGVENQVNFEFRVRWILNAHIV